MDSPCTSATRVTVSQKLSWLTHNNPQRVRDPDKREYRLGEGLRRKTPVMMKSRCINKMQIPRLYISEDIQYALGSVKSCTQSRGNFPGDSWNFRHIYSAQTVEAIVTVKILQMADQFCWYVKKLITVY